MRYWLALACLLYSIAAPAQGLRIAVVNISRLLETAPQAQTARTRLEEEFAPRDKALAEAQRTLRRLEDRLEKEGDTLGEGERRNLEREVVAQKRELRRAGDEFREDFNIRRNEELSRLQRQTYDTIVDFVKQEGYDLILETGVIYASQQVDITEQVLKRLQ